MHNADERGALRVTPREILEESSESLLGDVVSGIRILESRLWGSGGGVSGVTVVSRLK